MSDEDEVAAACPLPNSTYPEIVLAHGGGGALTNRLIADIFLPAFANPILAEGHDGAVFDIGGSRVAFTTDSYVVSPCFFPGGDIGSLAINGTVNDLLMCAARPLYLSVALVLEEGFPVSELERVVASMRRATEHAGVQLVTGDTKVVERGHGDGIFVNTSGVGIIEYDRRVSPDAVMPGDAVILSGDIGRHGMAVMSAREGLAFDDPIESDTAALGGPVHALLDNGIEVHCLRDPTRGGLATVLAEIAAAVGLDIDIDETAVPVSAAVRGACEVLGLDPLYVANEGRFVAFVRAEDRERALQLLRADPSCRDACAIGSVSDRGPGMVTAKTRIGGQRVLDLLTGEQLPRIC